MTNLKFSKTRYFLLLVYIPFIFGFFLMVGEAIHNPKRIQPATEGHMCIEDNIDILSDSEESMIMNEFRDFYSQTGITPCLITGYNSDWINNYSNMEEYAYYLYVNKFDDEKHFLIVYTQPEESDDFVNWYHFEMQGNDTDSIITESVGENYVNSLHTYLLQDTKYTVGEAIDNSFKDMNAHIMDFSLDAGALVGSVLYIGFICVHCYFMVFYDPNKKYRGKKIALVSEKYIKEIVCKYCGGVYVDKTVSSCPHCGSPLTLDELEANDEDYNYMFDSNRW